MQYTFSVFQEGMAERSIALRMEFDPVLAGHVESIVFAAAFKLARLTRNPVDIERDGSPRAKVWTDGGVDYAPEWMQS